MSATAYDVRVRLRELVASPRPTLADLAEAEGLARRLPAPYRREADEAVRILARRVAAHAPAPPTEG